MKKIDRAVREESKKQKGVLYCLNCGSPRLFYFIGGYAGWIYQCKECGYRGPLVVENGTIAAEISKRYSGKRKK